MATPGQELPGQVIPADPVEQAVQQAEGVASDLEARVAKLEGLVGGMLDSVAAPGANPFENSVKAALASLGCDVRKYFGRP